MSDKKADCSKGYCHVDKNKDGSKLVRSTDLPLTGNPYPPKDFIQNETPGSLEQTITSIRTNVQPYLLPIGTAYTKVSDVVSTGVAHSQSTFQGLRDNQNALISGVIIGGSSLFGLLIARRKGFIKKTLYVTTLFFGSAAICNPDAAKKYFDIGWVIAKNNLPNLASNQYQKLSGQLPTLSSSKKDEGATKKD